MTELERVLKGLDAHKRSDCRDNACPYAPEPHCMRNLIEDAIGLLKKLEELDKEEEA